MKKPEGLEARLELQRLLKGLRSPGDQRKLTSQLVFDALVRNKQSMKNMQNRLSKERRVEDLVKILQDKVEGIDPVKSDIGENLADYLVMIGVRKTDNNGINVSELFTRYEFQTLYNYIFIKLGLPSEYNIIMKYEQKIINHIHNNRPEILELLRDLGVDFSSNGEAYETNLEGGTTITIKKGSSVEETLDDIYRTLGQKKIERIFEEGKTQNPIRQWTDNQKATMRKLCYIMNQIYSEKGDMGKIANVIASKTGMSINTIKSTYNVSQIPKLEVKIES